MKRVLVNPKETRPLHDGYHFSQANPVGDMIWVSGQVGVDDKLTPASGMDARRCPDPERSELPNLLERFGRLC